MFKLKLMLSLVLALGWYVTASSGADEIKVRPEESARISTLIQQLGSASFDEREAAATELRQIGQSTVPQLKKAMIHKSVEVRSRAAAILRQQLRIPLRALQPDIQKFAAQPEEKLDLEEGMWLISRILNPQVDKATLTRQLDDLAKAVRKKLGDADPKSIDPKRAVAAVREVLFDDAKFGGNFADYTNPENSSLEKVLASRKGLPILVSHVVIAVARRLDVPVVGLPTSGRYIVKYDGQRAPAGFPKEDIFIDPFDNGKVLTREDRMELFPGADSDNLAKPATRRETLIRMLINLESHLFQRDENDLAFVAVEFRVALQDHMTEK